MSDFFDFDSFELSVPDIDANFDPRLINDVCSVPFHDLFGLKFIKEHTVADSIDDFLKLFKVNTFDELHLLDREIKDSVCKQSTTCPDWSKFYLLAILEYHVHRQEF